MAYAGHKCQVKVSGAGVSLTNEPTSTSDDLTFQITDTTKRILSPEADITVHIDPEADGTFVDADPSTYELNRLDGSVTFDTAQTGADVQISGEYLPLMVAAEAHEFSYSLEADNQDAPKFQKAYMNRIQGQKDMTAELSAWHDVNVTVFTDAVRSGKIMLFEFYVNNTLDLRAWCLAASDEIETAADGMVEEGIEFEGTTDKEGRMIEIG